MEVNALKLRKVYLVQANYTYSGSAHLPYAVGMLQAFSMKDDRVNSVYSFEQIIFQRKISGLV